jgi:enamine deaminase RidA (YjgF/YER057c/UK114 family)
MISTTGAKCRPRNGTGPETEALRRCTIAGIDCIAARGAHNSQSSLTVKLLPGESLVDLFRRLSMALKELDASILQLTVFGSTSASAEADEAMRRVFGGVDWPVTWVEGASCDGSPIAGVQVCALAGGAVQRIVQNERIVGSVFEEGGAWHCVLGGVGPREIRWNGAQQTRETIENMQAALGQAGFSFGDVVRTWFFLDDILSWYTEFNQVRTRMYSEHEFRSGSVPASTGIAGRNPAGAALVAGAWAVQQLSTLVRVQEVASPLQCPAAIYGSSFSRAMEISDARCKRLLVSGTASVGQEGATVHGGNARAQVAFAMKNVAAILESRGMSFADVTRATAYFTKAENAPIFAEWLARHGSGALPAVCACCDICRPDLHFEIELDAVRCGG